MGAKTYGQYCAVAKALDHVGDRWTLLIVRELLIGPRRYSEIRTALPGIATNLLAERLRDLEGDGVIEKVTDNRYSLTEHGKELEHVVHALVRWGGRWMVTRDEAEIFHPRWLVIALAALLPKRRAGRVELRVEGELLHVNRGSVGLGPIDEPDAVIEAPATELLGVAAGELPMSVLQIHGSRAMARSVLGR